MERGPKKKVKIRQIDSEKNFWEGDFLYSLIKIGKNALTMIREVKQKKLGKYFSRIKQNVPLKQIFQRKNMRIQRIIIINYYFKRQQH